MIVQRWREAGFQVMRGHAIRGKPKLSMHMMADISNIRFLRENAHLSLEDRARIIELKHGVKVTGATVRKYYRKGRITYRKPQYDYHKKLACQRGLGDQQQEIAKELVTLHMEGRHVIFIDETSFHRWMTKSRAWVKTGVSLPMASSRGPSFTLIAAISSQLGLVHALVILGSNNQDVFAGFVRGL